jgi:AraC-like DNA-binding protein
LQIGDPLQIVSAPSGRILFQDKRGFWEDDSRDWLEVLLREFSEREGLRRPFTIDLFIPSDAIQRRWTHFYQFPAILKFTIHLPRRLLAGLVLSALARPQRYRAPGGGRRRTFGWQRRRFLRQRSHYLSDADLSISQIAWLVGYQGIGAFSHSYKRWTGLNAKSMREKLIASHHGKAYWSALEADAYGR